VEVTQAAGAKVRAVGSRRFASFAVLGLVVWLSSATSTGCRSDSCGERDACPVVDQAPAPGDVVFTNLDPRSVVIFDPTKTADGSLLSNDLVLLGGEIVITPGPTFRDPFVLKRLRLELQDFTLAFNGAKSVTVSHAVLSIQAPVEVPVPGSDGVVPSGTMVHTCAFVDGQPWHGSAALERELFIQLDVPDDILVVRGDAPVVLRADDANCSRVTLDAGILVSNAAADAGGDAGETADAGDD
jgi:hypothetical protein